MPVVTQQGLVGRVDAVIAGAKPVFVPLHGPDLRLDIDAFAHRVFTGNPAAVVPLDAWIDDPTLQGIATENNLAETAFIVGGKVTTVDIRELIPPPDVQASMNWVLTAERTRRAVITESEGERQAKINVAEGEKQSAILQAEGVRQKSILEAEGYEVITAADGLTALEVARERGLDLPMIGRRG